MIEKESFNLNQIYLTEVSQLWATFEVNLDSASVALVICQEILAQIVKMRPEATGVVVLVCFFFLLFQACQTHRCSGWDPELNYCTCAIFCTCVQFSNHRRYVNLLGASCWFQIFSFCSVNCSSGLLYNCKNNNLVCPASLLGLGSFLWGTDSCALTLLVPCFSSYCL